MGGLHLLEGTHHAQPDPATVVDGHGNPWAPLGPNAMPCRGTCMHCGVPIRLDEWTFGDWYHDFFRAAPKPPGEISGGKLTGVVEKEDDKTGGDIGDSDSDDLR